MAKGDLSVQNKEQIKSQLAEAGENTSQISLFINQFTSWDNEFCAEHDGTIGSFEKLSAKIKDISDYKDIIGRDSINLVRAVKIACVGVAAGGTTLVTAGMATPAIAAALGSSGLLGAAATGTAISSLSGAALTSASLAAIGGSVAAGTAIITACGAALGGSLGGVITNKYIGEDSSFKITKLSDSIVNNNVVFINGFLQKDEISFSDWITQQKNIDTDCNMFGVNWASSSNLNLGQAVTVSLGGKGAAIIAAEMAKTGGKVAAKGLGGFVSILTGAYTAFANDWHVSMVKAASTGVILSDLVSRTENKYYDFAGHSLGARAIFYMLESLRNNRHRLCLDKIRIGNIFLLGGAVGNDAKDWERLTDLIDGKIYNCYSRQDDVLKYLYKNANAYISDPIGYSPIKTSSCKIDNIDCTQLVTSHMKWKANFSAIRQKILSGSKHF